MTTAPARAARTPAPALALPTAVAVLSLVATAAMWAGFPVVPPLAWAAALVAVAVGCAAAARRARGTQTGAASHLAVEPFAMALMVVLDLFHTHGRAESTTAASHAGHVDALALILPVAVAMLAALCPVLAVRHARRVGFARGALPVVAAIAMAIMAAGMLLPH